MKLKYLAAFLMLLALGCTPSSETTPTAEEGSDPAVSTPEVEVTTTVEPATETDTTLASTTTVKFDVTGMR